MSGPILIVDDEKNIRRTLSMVLEGEGHTTIEAASIAEAQDALAANPSIDLVLLDVKLGDDNGLDLLRGLKARGGDDDAPAPLIDADVPVVMISGHATIEDAVAATRLGAFDFMEKPLDRHRVLVTVRNALDRRYADRADYAFGTYRYFPGRGRALFAEIAWARD